MTKLFEYWRCSECGEPLKNHWAIDGKYIGCEDKNGIKVREKQEDYWGEYKT